MRAIYSVFNSNGAYKTGPHEHEEFMLMVPEHGLLRFNDEDGGWSTTLIERQFLLVPPRWTHSSASLTGIQGHGAFYVDPEYMRHALRDLSSDASKRVRRRSLQHSPGEWKSYNREGVRNGQGLACDLHR